MHRMYRRNVLFALIGTAAAVVLSACGSSSISVDDVIKKVRENCGIIIIAATILEIIAQSKNATVDGIVGLICAGYESAKLAEEKKLGGALKSGSEITFFVVTDKGEKVEVKATVK